MADLSIPLIGLGTWMSTDIEQAIEIGYRHIDTAASYDTEIPVQQAVLDSSLPRDAFFVVTKYGSGRIPTPSEMYRYHLNGHKQGFTYFDLILLHHPPLTDDPVLFEKELLRDLKALYTLQRAGYTRNIGVSNFYSKQLGFLIELCHVNNLPLPVVNQLEIHLINQERELVDACQQLGIQVVAHTPLGGLAANQLLEIDILRHIGDRIGATPAQVQLAFIMKRSIPVLPRSSNALHLRENYNAVKYIDLLTQDDVALLESIDQQQPLLELSIACYNLDTRLSSI
jgi:diketogulonate reductase-like aldo/keto reductase